VISVKLSEANEEDKDAEDKDETRSGGDDDDDDKVDDKP